MKNILIILVIAMFFTGCTTFTEKEQESLKEGIVDACYTVTEYNPEDKTIRIDNYLLSKIEDEIITDKEAEMIKRCLRRTEQSKKWDKNE